MSAGSSSASVPFRGRSFRPDSDDSATASSMTLTSVASKRGSGSANGVCESKCATEKTPLLLSGAGTLASSPDFHLKGGNESINSGSYCHGHSLDSHADTPKADPPSASAVLLRDFVVGVINVILTIPCLYGYTAVVFGNPAFAPVRSHFARLFLFSSCVHQLCTLRSALPFAIGQVQDAGLIFLAVIANGLVASMPSDAPPEDLWATTVVCLCLSTAALGVALVVLARVKFAKFVAYLPIPVIAGYLAFIGYFCLQAGIALCTELGFASLKDWVTVFTSLHLSILAIPALAGGVALVLVARRYTHPAALPLAMLSLPAAFFAILALSGGSLASARAGGWVSEAISAATVSDVLSIFDFSRVHWSIMPAQIPRWAAMTLVVAFSSCLDVAAIEIELGRPLNVNAELEVIGIGNALSGLLAGFPGSYIFSQTIFTCRTGSRSQIVGWIVAISELILFVLPVDIMSIVPRFFFAATLIFIAYDLMYEWLVEVRIHGKVSPPEHVVALVTFTALLAFGVETGLAVGVAVAALQFVVAYAKTATVTASWPVSSGNKALQHDIESAEDIADTITLLASSSPTLGPASISASRHTSSGHAAHVAPTAAAAAAAASAATDAARLSSAHGQVCVLALTGHIFFGSAQALLERASEHVFVHVSERGAAQTGGAALATVKRVEEVRAEMHDGSISAPTPVSALSTAGKGNHLVHKGDFPSASSMLPLEVVVSSLGVLGPAVKAAHVDAAAAAAAAVTARHGSSGSSTVTVVHMPPAHSGASPSSGHGDTPLVPKAIVASACGSLEVIRPTSALVLDFSRVSSVDSTAVRACFSALCATVRGYGVDVVLTCVPEAVENLLRANGVLPACPEGPGPRDSGLVLPPQLTSLASRCDTPLSAPLGAITVAPCTDAGLAWAEARQLLHLRALAGEDGVWRGVECV